MAKKPTIQNANLTFNGQLTPINKNSITHLVQHHMAHPTWGMIDVHHLHKKSRKWVGIGYNWWIGFDGTIYEGRGFNIGAHCSGHNSTSLGIGYQGDFTKQKMTDAQLKAGRALNEWLLSELGIAKSAMVAHKDLASTACPGKNFRMAELKQGSRNVANNDNKPSPWAKDVWENMTKQGYFDGTRPQDYITRQEVAAVLERLLRNK